MSVYAYYVLFQTLVGGILYNSQVPVKTFKDGDSILRNRYIGAMNKFTMEDAVFTTGNFTGTDFHNSIPGKFYIDTFYMGADTRINGTFYKTEDNTYPQFLLDIMYDWN